MLQACVVFNFSSSCACIHGQLFWKLFSFYFTFLITNSIEIKIAFKIFFSSLTNMLNPYIRTRCKNVKCKKEVLKCYIAVLLDSYFSKRKRSCYTRENELHLKEQHQFRLNSICD